MAIQTIMGVAFQYGGSLISLKILTGSGTYTPSPGCSMIDVTAIGAGGGGGGVKGVVLLKGVSAGGSSGGFSRKLISPVVPGFGYVYSVGTGGAGGAGSTPAAGADGGATTFGSSILTCPGGMGAPGVTADSGAAAITYAGAGIGSPATGGDFNSAGMPGGMAWNFVTLGAAFGSDYVSGAGGDRPHYGSGGPSIRGGSNDGNVGVGYGAGGSGATTSGTTSRNGGNGADGVIIVAEYS